MISSTFNFEFSDLKLTSSQIEAVLGHYDMDGSELVTDLILQILDESAGISDIKAQFKIFEDVFFDNATKSLMVNKSSLGINKIIFSQLKRADNVAVFLCTAGGEIGDRSRKAMQERDYLKGYIYDVVGSEIAEAAGDLMQANLESTMIDSGKKITNRYSPGYCGWDVVEQHKIFELIPGNYCGIKLTPSALMDPVKSISGIIGIGKNVKKHPYTCGLCNQNDCVYRSSREKTGK